MSLQNENGSEDELSDQSYTPTHGSIENIDRQRDHIIVCGSRNIDTHAAKTAADTVEDIFETLFTDLNNDKPGPAFIHGDADGVDTHANNWVMLKQNEQRGESWPTIAVPADWNNIDHPDASVKEGKYGKYDAKAGIRRNIQMSKFIKHRQVGEDYDTYCLAIIAPDENGKSKGTQHMIEEFRRTHNENNLLIIPIGPHWKRMDNELHQFTPYEQRWGEDFYQDATVAKQRMEQLTEIVEFHQNNGQTDADSVQKDFDDIETDSDDTNPDSIPDTDKLAVNLSDIDLYNDHHERRSYVDQTAEQRGLNRGTFLTNRPSLAAVPENGHYTVVEGNDDILDYLKRTEIVALLKTAIPNDTDCIITQRRNRNVISDITAEIAREADIPHMVVPMLWHFTEHPDASTATSETMGEYDKTAGFRRCETVAKFLSNVGDHEVIALYQPERGDREDWATRLLDRTQQHVTDPNLRMLCVGNTKESHPDNLYPWRVNQNQDEKDRELHHMLRQFDDLITSA